MNQRAYVTDAHANLEAALIASKEPQHPADTSRQRGDAGFHHGVTERDELVALYAGDGAQAHGAHVAADELHANGATVFIALGRGWILSAAPARL